MTHLPDILTVPEIQEYLHIGKRQAYELCKDPDFPSFRIGGSIRIPKKSFFEWLGIDEEESAYQEQVLPQKMKVELEIVVMTK